MAWPPMSLCCAQISVPRPVRRTFAGVAGRRLAPYALAPYGFAPCELLLRSDFGACLAPYAWAPYGLAPYGLLSPLGRLCLGPQWLGHL